MGGFVPVRTMSLSWPGTAAAVAMRPGIVAERSIQSPAALGGGGADEDDELEEDDDDLDEDGDDDEDEKEELADELADELDVTFVMVAGAGSAEALSPPPQLFRMAVPRATPSRCAVRRAARAVLRGG
jgi:hypothetical protein